MISAARHQAAGAPGGVTARAIRRVIGGRQLQTVLQPIMEMGTGFVVGYEALSRFPRPRVCTQAWFDGACSLGLGVELEVAALKAAVAETAPLLSTFNDVYVALNLSPSTLLDPQVYTLLAQLPAHRIVIELTERQRIIASAEHDVIRALRDAGIRIALDDVGAGYADLRRLFTVRPDIIKLDRTIIATVGTDRSHRLLVRAFVAFAEDLGVSLVAEGIEEPRQAELLQQLGVRLGQGYLLGPPAQGRTGAAAPLDVA